VLKPGTGSGFLTDEEGNPIQATGDDGSPLYEDDGSGNLVPVFIPNSGNVIIDGNLAPSSGHALTLGTPELRYSGIYLASWFKYDTDGLYFYYTADERTPKDYFHARFTMKGLRKITFMPGLQLMQLLILAMMAGLISMLTLNVPVIL